MDVIVDELRQPHGVFSVSKDEGGPVGISLLNFEYHFEQGAAKTALGRVELDDGGLLVAGQRGSESPVLSLPLGLGGQRPTSAAASSRQPIEKPDGGNGCGRVH